MRTGAGPYSLAVPVSPAIDDLFGHVPQKGAPEANIEDRSAFDWRLPSEIGFIVPTPPAPEGGHTAASIREQVMKIMTVVRAAETMPFAADELHTHTVWMPYYCEWLKNGEGDALLAEFRDKMDSLRGLAA